MRKNCISNRQALRTMIAERGIDGVLEDLGMVCFDIANEKHNVETNYAEVWNDRGDELIELGREYNKGRRADR